jgi:hypothetical protein
MERLSIGDLARETGLTVRALRHYQDLGLLVPAGVARPPVTGPTVPSSSSGRWPSPACAASACPWLASATTWPPSRPSGGGCSRTIGSSWTPGSAPPLSSSRS